MRKINTTVKDSKGSVSVIISLLVTAVIAIISILYNASMLRSHENIITSSLVAQHDLVLSGYSEILFDRYGLLATNLQYDYENAFNYMTKNTGANGYNVTGSNELSGGNLINAVSHFSKHKFPLAIAIDIYNRFSDTGDILENLLSRNISGALSGGNKYLKKSPDTYKEENIDYHVLHEILKKTEKAIYVHFMNQQKEWDFSFEDFSLAFLQEEREIVFENENLKKFKASLTITEAGINEVSEFIEKFFNPDLPVLYERILIEYYIQKMFSCKVNYSINNSVKRYSRDIQNRKIEYFQRNEKLEIEKIIFGFDNQELNEYFVAASIRSVRTLLHFLAYLYDEEKHSQIKYGTIFFSALILALSGGSVYVPPENMEIFTIIMMSVMNSIKDYIDLSKGESVSFLPVKSENNPETYYKDYLLLLQFMIPVEVKTARMLEIIKENTDNSNNILYSGVKVSCFLNGVCYSIEGDYYAR